MVTEFSHINGQWTAQSTLPATGGFGFAGDRFLVRRDMGKLSATQRRVKARPADQRRLKQPEICVRDNGGLIYSIRCRLNLPGPWNGLLLFSYSFHTSSHDEGTVVEYLDTNALIDGRLFEWDREISLAK